MARRSYGQHCGLAAALDAVGERWTMLLVRDLGLGPRRFGDLFKGLPGISTDLLAERLRTLEAVGAVTKRKLAPPVSVAVYELTEEGRELQSIVSSLARWGTRLLPEPGTPGYLVELPWALQSMVAHYTGGLPDGVYELRLDDREYVITVAEASAAVADGPPRREPLLVVTAPAGVFLAMMAGRTTLASARAGGLTTKGDSRLTPRFASALSLAS